MQDAAGRPRGAFEQGVALLREGRHEEALRCFDEVLAAGPDADAFHNRGAAYAALGRWAAAYEDFTRALALRDHADLSARQALSNEFYMAGVCLRRLGRAQDAVTFLEKAIELRPGYVAALRLLADVRRALGDEAAAKKLLDRALELQPGDPEALSQRCVENLKAHRYAEALLDAEAHVAARTGDAVGWFNKACALAFLGRSEEALAAVDRAIALDSSDGRYHYERALLLHSVGRGEEAERALARSRQMGYFPAPEEVAAAPGEVVLAGALRRFAGSCPLGAELWRVETGRPDALHLVVAVPPRRFFPFFSLARRRIQKSLARAMEDLRRTLAWQTDVRTLRVDVLSGEEMEKLLVQAGPRASKVR